jgi:predicted ABC-type ATPase
MPPPEPRILVVAGPNGSGKSTVTAGIAVIGTYVNADDIGALSEIDSLQAAQEAERLREHLLARRASFTFETVLSTPRNLDLLTRAKAAGYRIEAVFVLTVDSELNVLRVRGRVAAGGHDVPPQKIRDRYARSLANLPPMIQLRDVCTVFDNRTLPRVIYRKDASREAVAPTELWSPEAITRLVQPATSAR